MRILISTAGSHGDILPFVALAKEFLARGHEVFLYANPLFRHYVADCNISFIPIGTVEQYKSLFNETSHVDSTTAFKLVAKELSELTPKYYYSMKADVIAGQTISIGCSMLFSHRLLRETDGVPCATIHLAPSIFQSNLAPARLVPHWVKADTNMAFKNFAWWLLDKTFYEPHFSKPLNKFRTELGLVSLKQIFRSWIHEADCLIGMFPNWFALAQTDWAKQPILTGFPLYDHAGQSDISPELNEFLDKGSAPVLFTVGTATASAEKFYTESINACRITGQRAIILSHFSDQKSKQFDNNIFHTSYVPFSVLLPKLATFVHHGGIGTVSQALKAGVPQLIRPVAYDQFDNSARAVALGVAREISANKYTANNIATALTVLSSDNSLHQNCLNIASLLDNARSIPAAADSILHQLSQ